MLFLLNSAELVPEDVPKNYFVTISYKFYLRKYVNSRGFSGIYLHISSNGRRIKKNLGLEVVPKDWDRKSCRAKTSSQYNKDVNLCLDNIESSITSIRTNYRLSKKSLSLEQLSRELDNKTPRVDFIAFMQHCLNDDIAFLSKGTVIKHQSVINKIKMFKSSIYFSEVDSQFIKDFKKYCISQKNTTNTINSNIRVMRKYINKANRMGIVMPIDKDDLKAPNIKGKRVDLHHTEIKKLHNYLKSEFIPDHHRPILALFLFSCYTGLRISDLLKINEKNIINNVLSFTPHKTKKFNKELRISLNNLAQSIIPYINWKQNFSEQYLNREIKIISRQCNITKKVSFHVARHSFATNLLRAGASVVKVQQLMGHSNIRETMIYAHIVEQEANEDIFLLDNL